MNVIKRLQMGEDSAAKVQVEGNEVKSSCSAVVEDSSVEDNCVEDSVELNAVVSSSFYRLFSVSKEVMKATCKELSIVWRENANLEHRPEPPVASLFPSLAAGHDC